MEHQLEQESGPCKVCGQYGSRLKYPCPEAKVYSWEPWPEGLATERQLKEKGLLAWGEVAGVIWYTNKYLERGKGGHWLRLYRIDEAKPKPINEKRKAAAEKAKETAKKNRTCVYCQRDVGVKIKRASHLCGKCERIAGCITTARKWLASNAVIVDTETTGLDSGYSNILQVSVVDIPTGNILLDTYVKPDEPIDETQFTTREGWYGEEEVPTAFGINGITNEMVKDAPSFTAVWEKLKPLIDGKLVICYNVEFDGGMIKAHVEKYNLPPAENTQWECAMNWYAEYNGEWHRRYGWVWVSLSEACHDRDISVNIPAHTGAGDCFRTLELIKTIAALPMPEGIKEHA